MSQIVAPNNDGSVLQGGAGDDTLIASHAGDTLTGGAGKDVFQLPYAPNSPVHVTDFTPGTDVLDLRALVPNYHGTDPLNDGYLDYGPDGNGGTIVWVDPDGTGPDYQYYAVDLEGVGWNNLKVGQDILMGGADSGSGGAGGGTSGSGGGSTGTGSTGGAGQHIRPVAGDQGVGPRAADQGMAGIVGRDD